MAHRAGHRAGSDRRRRPGSAGRPLRGAGDAAKAGHYYGQAADEAADTLAFDRAAKLYQNALQLRPDRGRRDLPAPRPPWRRPGQRRPEPRRGPRLPGGGRAARRQAEQLDLQRREAYQFLISGHIDEGLAAFASILDRVGMPLPGTPRKALMRLLQSRTTLRLRGLRFRERDASQVDPARLELIDISRSVAVGISVVDVIRGSDYQTRSLLQALLRR